MLFCVLGRIYSYAVDCFIDCFKVVLFHYGLTCAFFVTFLLTCWVLMDPLTYGCYGCFTNNECFLTCLFILVLFLVCGYGIVVVDAFHGFVFPIVWGLFLLLWVVLLVNGCFGFCLL